MTLPIPAFISPTTPLGELGPIVDFWQWALSDALGNTKRSMLAEYIVGKAIGADLTMPHVDWHYYDIAYGETHIEVKSSAYTQAWYLPDAKPYKPRFDIAPKKGWDFRANRYYDTSARRAHLYVFCLLNITPTDPVRNPLDLSKWEFYVTSTQQLEAHVTPEQKSIGLTRVQKICGAAVNIAELKAKINQNTNRR